MESTQPPEGRLFDPARFALAEDDAETNPGDSLLGRRGLPYTHSGVPPTSNSFRWWHDGQRPYALAFLNWLCDNPGCELGHAMQVYRSEAATTARRVDTQLSTLAACGLVGRWLDDPELLERSDNWWAGWHIEATVWAQQLVQGRQMDWRPPPAENTRDALVGGFVQVPVDGQLYPLVEQPQLQCEHLSSILDVADSEFESEVTQWSADGLVWQPVSTRASRPLRLTAIYRSILLGLELPIAQSGAAGWERWLHQLSIRTGMVVQGKRRLPGAFGSIWASTFDLDWRLR